MSAALEQELSVLESIIENPSRPFALLVGGNRIGKKLGIIKNLLPKVDKILVGGLVACAFHRVQGITLGEVAISSEDLSTATGVWNTAKERGVPIILAEDAVVLPTGLFRERFLHARKKLGPSEEALTQTQSQTDTTMKPESMKGAKIDLHSSSPLRPGRTTANMDQALYAQEKEEEQRAAAQRTTTETVQRAAAETLQCAPAKIPKGYMPVDIGERSVQTFCQELRGCNTVLWIGLLGACEVEDYAEGSKQLMTYLANLCAGGATAVVCGGHTVSLVDKSQYGRCFTRVARVYDGALAEMLEGKAPHGDTIRVPSY